MTAEEIIEKSMQYHLGVKMPDEAVMCLCDGRLFDGPVFHRRHVAQVAAQALRDGRPPTRPHDEEVSISKEERHMKHYRSCNCLGDSDRCCDPSCCHPTEMEP